MELTRKQWMDALSGYFKSCFSFLLSQGLDINDSKTRAKEEALKATTYPFSPNGMIIPPDIKADFVKQLELV